MPRLLVSIAIVGFLAGDNASSRALSRPSSQAPALSCVAAGALVRLPGVIEASGAAASRRHPGIIWTHNDSGDPVVFAFDAGGKARARVTVSGATVTDWEDVALGPCPQGTCLYIADIGDNNRARRQITIYRVPEPALNAQTTEPADVMVLTYPDGARDAEAVFVTDGQLFVVSKTSPALTALYRAPLGGGSAVLTTVAKLPLDRVTGGTISPDGTWVGLRSNEELTVYRTKELTSGKSAVARRVALTPFAERQGERVAIGGDGMIYLVGEGTGGGGTLVPIRCQLG